ncbi:MAG: fibronectin type III domain-containing protein, partial [Flavobacterium sp.]|nr:fibronectin type III domain-containing protein [Flavobacterium sp.]
MKNRFLQFSIATLVVLFFGCSTSSDGNGNSTTTVVPIVPTNLTAVLVNNQVLLNWNDSSTNEMGFKIDRKEGTAAWSVNYATVANDIETYTDAAVTAGSTYTYRVYSYNSVGPSLGYSNPITVTISTAITLATLTTTAVSGITTTAAATGGTITSDGGAAIIARGIVWSNLPNPTIDLPTQTSDDSGIGTFTSTISGLNPNWDYHVRAYATNSAGTAYGNEITFTTLQNSTAINVPGPNVTDIDSNTYQSVTNCGLTFTKQNLNVSKYSDGTAIPQVTDPTAWQ